jgi:hypothetical protein
VLTAAGRKVLAAESHRLMKLLRRPAMRRLIKQEQQ